MDAFFNTTKKGDCGRFEASHVGELFPVHPTKNDVVGSHRDLINYPGSKGGAGVWQAIISAMPRHKVYIEPFVGSGQILLRKTPATASIVIDADERVCRFWDTKKLAGVTVCNGDALRFLKSYNWKGEELVYCDPPYLRGVRSCQRDYYRHEFASESEHLELLAVLMCLPCPVILSGYQSELYDKTLIGWRKLSVPTVKRNGERSSEILWLNFPEPFIFHDTSHAGKNYRERERIKRKKLRWKNRLLKMPQAERAAIIDAISELQHHQK